MTVSSGSAASIHYSESQSYGPYSSSAARVIRITKDDAWLETVTHTSRATPPTSDAAGGLSRNRGEIWQVSYGVTASSEPGLTLRRARPGEPLAMLKEFYPANFSSSSVYVSIDDSGRALFVVRASGLGYWQVVVWD